MKTMLRIHGSWALCACLIAMGAAPLVKAADAASAGTTAGAELEEIVITGTAGGAELRKQDASFSVTTISSDQIEAAAPKSSAELLTQIPGVWVESSGGVAGANINVLGFPEAGDAPHVTFEINGAPLYGTESLSFMEQSTLFRVDETIASVEGALGGPASVFGKGEPGLTSNFRLKEGGEQTSGIIKYTGSDYNLQRVDAEMSGMLTDDLFYMVGGYVAASPGIRDAQFLSEKGHQFTVNLTKKLEKGKIGLWTRITDDVGQWLLPIASNSGNNLGTFSQLGDYTRVRSLQVGVDGANNPIMQSFDFANGRGWRGSVSGLNAEFNASDNITLRDNLSVTRGNADTYGFVPDGGAIQVSALGLAPGAVKTLHGSTLAQADYVQEYGYWVVKKDLRSFTNDISVQLKTSATNDLTVGYYVAQWSSNDWWSLNNQAPVQNTANGDLLSANVTCARLATAGSGAGCWHYGINSNGDATANALYVADSFKVTSALRLDGGIRHERQTIDYWLDSGPGYPDGTRDLTVPHASASENSYTGAADYAFSSENGLFGRYTTGVHFPMFDDERGGSNQVQSIKEGEVGFKHTDSRLKLYATAFWNTTDSNIGGVGTVQAVGSTKSRAYGIVVDGSLRIEHFGLGWNGTFQDATYTAATDPTIIGKKVLRQPNVRVLLSPSYNQMFGDYSASLYGSVGYIGSRYADPQNARSYGAYTTIDAGVKIETPWKIDFQLYGENLSNRHDATEGDPRSNVGAQFRPILGRSIQFSVSYKL